MTVLNGSLGAMEWGVLRLYMDDMPSRYVGYL